MSRQPRRLQLDMDGIFVDFHKGIALANNCPIDWSEPGNRCVTIAMGIPPPWYAKCDVDFWANLPKMSDADVIINLLMNYFEPEEIFVCTAFEDGTPEEKIGECIAGKLKWLKKHYGGLHLQVAYTNAKHGLAMDRALLVDDNDRNVEGFRLHGGKAILLPRIWNSRHAISNEAYPVLAGELHDIYGF